MCKLGLVLLFSLITGSNYAQGYFVLLQSANRQAFYVRLGTQLYSSTPAGHLILSQLKDSTYTMAVGFPGRPGVEQSYALTPSQKDQEFEIRDHGDAGWDLYDMQTKEWLTAVSRSGGREEVRAIGVRRDDAFSRMMAGVVHDTAVLYNDYANSELAVAPAVQPATPGTGTPVTGTTATGTTPTGTPATGTPATGVPASATPPTATPAPGAPATGTPATGSLTTGASPKGIPTTGIPATVTPKPGTATSASSTSVSPLPASATPANSVPTNSAPVNSASASKPDTTTALVTRIDTPVIKPEAVAAATNRPDSPIALQAKFDTPVITTGGGIAKADSPAVNTGVLKQDSPVSTVRRGDIPSNSFKPDPLAATDSSTREALHHPMPSVVKLSERRMTRNMRIVYADKGKDAKLDTVVVIIPLDTPQTTAARPRNANPDSSLANVRKFRSVGPDSAHTAAKPGNPGPDSNRAASIKPRNTGQDSGHSASINPHNPNPDSNRSALAKPRNPGPDSAHTNTARSKGSNYDSPSNVRAIIPTPFGLSADKSRPNDSAKKPAAKSPLPYVNSDCHAFATDYDVDKLRVKMLEAPKDDERIAAALKIFKTKCFYTREIKALSEVFPTDASRYRFFETAYPFAADEHFRELGALLTDPVYQNKFKSLVH